MTGPCGGLAGPEPEAALCRPGWEHLPTDLRRLLAETWGAAIDGDPDGPALHECAHVLAVEYRAGYHRRVQVARAERDALRRAS